MHKSIAIEIIDMVTRKLKKNIIATPREKSQNATTKIHARLKVTTCLYLKPDKRVRALCTLIAVSLNRETPQKVTARLLKSNLR